MDDACLLLVVCCLNEKKQGNKLSVYLEGGSAEARRQQIERERESALSGYGKTFTLSLLARPLAREMNILSCALVSSSSGRGEEVVGEDWGDVEEKEEDAHAARESMAFGEWYMMEDVGEWKRVTSVEGYIRCTVERVNARMKEESEREWGVGSGE